MHRGFKVMREAVRQSPSLLLSMPQSLQEEAAKMLPYSTGIEVEATFSEETTNKWNRGESSLGGKIINLEAVEQEALRNIPYLMTCDFDQNEQRFRIPAGIKGLICLEHISNWMKEHMELNMASGIHYHIDFSEMDFFNIADSSERFTKVEGIAANSQWMLKPLKSWNYTGSFNSWTVSYMKTAVKFHTDYKTVEFRIGEMTFDYSLMIKRILNLQNICRKFKTDYKKGSLKSPKRTKVEEQVPGFVMTHRRIRELLRNSTVSFESACEAFRNAGYTIIP